jgi:uncharacterized protein YciI
MQFIVIGRDGSDNEALNRRLSARPDHIAMGDEAVKRGEQLMGVALLDDKNEMCGSILLVDFPTRIELDEWLKVEPYVVQGVWKEIEVYSAKVGPSFIEIFKK